jgi:four helix bundle protein
MASFSAEVEPGSRRAACSGEGMAESVICARSFAFGCRLLKVCSQVWERGPAGRHVAQQLMRSGTSIGANAEEAQEAQTKPDFIAKLSVSRKEAPETHYWLRLSIQAGIATTAELGWAINEISEIRAMLIAAIRTARASSTRGEKPM